MSSALSPLQTEDAEDEVTSPSQLRCRGLKLREVRFQVRFVPILAILLTATAAGATPPTTCGASDDYGKALCAYQQRRFADAEAAFRAIVEKNVPEPETLHAIYFLARTQMKTGRFDEAAALFIRIHDLDGAFYATWNCDYLLGECRKAVGK